jgi:hypothetical protein
MKVLLIFLAATASVVVADLNIDELIRYASNQYTRLAGTVPGTGRFISTGDPTSETWRTTDDRAWTVGFYAGSLWMLYKHTGDTKWRDLALINQDGLTRWQYDTGSHDIGFIIMSSFGLGLDLTGNQSYVGIIDNSAKSLGTRFFGKFFERNIR